MENTVYVDWKKVRLLIDELKIDLSEYGGSDVNYLSQKMERPWSTIKRIKDEHTTTLKTIGEMAMALGCHPVDLISASGFPDPKSNAPAGRLIIEPS